MQKADYLVDPEITFMSLSHTQDSPSLVDRCSWRIWQDSIDNCSNASNDTSVNTAGLDISCFSERTSTHYSCHFNGKKQGPLFPWLNINIKWILTECCQ